MNNNKSFFYSAGLMLSIIFSPISHSALAPELVKDGANNTRQQIIWQRYAFNIKYSRSQVDAAITLLTQSKLITVDRRTFMLQPAKPSVELLGKTVADIAGLVFNKETKELTRITEEEIKQTKEAMESLLIDTFYPYGTDKNIEATILMRIKTADRYASLVKELQQKITENDFDQPKYQAPVFYGLDPVTIPAGTPFDLMAGVSAIDEKDGDITNKVRTGGWFDPNRAGNYYPWYYVMDSEGYSTTRYRSIVVTNTAPVLSGIEDVTIPAGTEFDLRAGVTAFDKEDGDITSKIQVSGRFNADRVGRYSITYRAIDSAGRSTSKRRVITVIDSEPVFSGVEDKTIPLGSTFNPLEGVKAIDPEEGDITDRIIVTGRVNTNWPRTYRLTYSVRDSYHQGPVRIVRRITVAR